MRSAGREGDPRRGLLPADDEQAARRQDGARRSWSRTAAPATRETYLDHVQEVADTDASPRSRDEPTTSSSARAAPRGRASAGRADPAAARPRDSARRALGRRSVATAPARRRSSARCSACIPAVGGSIERPAASAIGYVPQRHAVDPLGPGAGARISSPRAPSRGWSFLRPVLATARRATASSARSTRRARAPLARPALSRSLRGGEAARPASARALAGAPDLLVLDEPTSAMDIVAEREVIELPRELRETLGLGDPARDPSPRARRSRSPIASCSSTPTTASPSPGYGRESWRTRCSRERYGAVLGRGAAPTPPPATDEAEAAGWTRYAPPPDAARLPRRVGALPRPRARRRHRGRRRSATSACTSSCGGWCSSRPRSRRPPGSASPSPSTRRSCSARPGSSAIRSLCADGFTLAHDAALLARASDERWMSRESLLGVGLPRRQRGRAPRRHQDPARGARHPGHPLRHRGARDARGSPASSSWSAALVARCSSSPARGFRFASFDRDGARIRGLPVRLLDAALFASIAVTVSRRDARARRAARVRVQRAAGDGGDPRRAQRPRRRWSLAALFGAIAGGVGYVVSFLYAWPVGAERAKPASPLRSWERWGSRASSCTASEPRCGLPGRAHDRDAHCELAHTLLRFGWQGLRIGDRAWRLNDANF